MAQPSSPATSASFSEVFAAALRGEPCTVHGVAEDELRLLPVGAWQARADEADAALLDRCVGPTLDIGCGPGRMTQHLAERGHTVLGIDLVPEAVFQTRDRGVAAMLRDVFAPLPGEGRWGTALLADGNIGIGGDPEALLARVADLLAGDGRVVVDLDPPGTGLVIRKLSLSASGRTSRPFPWALVGADVLTHLAAGVGLRVAELDQHGTRWFGVLEKVA